MFRAAAEFIQRVFWAGAAARPTTETFQRAILTHVSLTGRAALTEIAERSFPLVQTEVRDHGIVEAAQILVNRGELVAEKNGARVDPVNAGLHGVSVRPVARGE